MVCFCSIYHFIRPLCNQTRPYDMAWFKHVNLIHTVNLSVQLFNNFIFKDQMHNYGRIIMIAI